MWDVKKNDIRQDFQSKKTFEDPNFSINLPGCNLQNQ